MSRTPHRPLPAARPDLADPSVLLGRLAAALAGAGRAGLPDALALLVEGAHLRSAVLQDPAGAVLAAAGEHVAAVVPLQRAAPELLDVAAPSGEVLGRLVAVPGTTAAATVRPLLRAAAGVVGLALAADRPSPAAALLQDATADREALAGALHDGPVQDLVAARWACDLLARGGDPVAAELRDTVQAALVGMRRTLWQLRGRGADGLGAALAALSDQLQAAGGPPLDLPAEPLDAVRGPVGALAVRLVQALAGDPTGAPHPSPVRVRLDGDVLELAAVLPAGPDPAWSRAAQAVGAALTCLPGVDGRTAVRLSLPPLPTSKDLP